MLEDDYIILIIVALLILLIVIFIFLYYRRYRRGVTTIIPQNSFENLSKSQINSIVNAITNSGTPIQHLLGEGQINVDVSVDTLGPLDDGADGSVIYWSREYNVWAPHLLQHARGRMSPGNSFSFTTIDGSVPSVDFGTPFTGSAATNINYNLTGNLNDQIISVVPVPPNFPVPVFENINFNNMNMTLSPPQRAGFVLFLSKAKRSYFIVNASAEINLISGTDCYLSIYAIRFNTGIPLAATSIASATTFAGGPVGTNTTDLVASYRLGPGTGFQQVSLCGTEFVNNYQGLLGSNTNTFDACYFFGLIGSSGVASGTIINYTLSVQEML